MSSDRVDSVDCEVRFTAMPMRLRYKILTINQDNYIIDSDKPLWVLLFPFFYWLIPHTVYKIEDEEVLQQIKAPEVELPKRRYGSIFVAGGISVVVANLLTPFMYYFNIPMTTPIKFLILLFFIGLAVFVRLYMSKVNRENVEIIVKLAQLPTEKLWIRPQSWQYLLKYTFFYLFFMALAVSFVLGYIDFGNIMLLLFSMLITFVLLLANILTMIEGNTKVKFKDNNTPPI